MKIVTIIGARPQFIKASAFSRLVQAAEGVVEIIVHTGQHYDENMSDVFFRELEIPAPHHRFATGGQNHGAMTGRQLEAIEKVLFVERPDVVLVYGDTNSTLAGALAAVKLHVPVAHVEAGLRSHNRRMPEEINRVLTDHISEWLFVPTAAAERELEREGVDPRHVFRVGDVMYDVALYFGEKARTQSSILQRLGVSAGEYAVATLHRAENVDDVLTLRGLVTALLALAKRMPLILPVHPRTRHRLEESGVVLGQAQGIRFLDPVGYLDMTRLLQGARVVLTDSGGLQKEAFFHRVPCVTLRTETEWQELVDIGWNRIPATLEPLDIEVAVNAALSSRGHETPSPYGDGRAAHHILDQLRTGRLGVA